MAAEIKENEKMVIAAFDFDGTIIKRDSLPLFILFAASFQQLLLGSIRMSPFLLLLKLKLIPNARAKERLLGIFFAGLHLNEFNLLSERFISRIEKMVNPLALEKIKWHQQMQHEVVIISASAENWIRPWAKKNGIDIVLATRLQVTDDLVTGKLLSENCLGTEKVNRLLDKYPRREDYILYAYGDSNGDKELLELADHAFYRCF